MRLGYKHILFVLIIAHILFLANKCYLIDNDTYLNQEQYELYLSSSKNAIPYIVTHTEVFYFRKIPEWTINIIYAAYLCIVGYLFFPKIQKKELFGKTQTEKLSTTKWKLLSISLLVVTIVLLIYIYYIGSSTSDLKKELLQIDSKVKVAEQKLIVLNKEKNALLKVSRKRPAKTFSFEEMKILIKYNLAIPTSTKDTINLLKNLQVN